MLFTGCITADAAVREITGARRVTGFTVAINDRFKDKEGARKTVTTFVECSYWVNHGLAPYLTKGSVVEIFGRVEAKAWLNGENKPQPYLACSVRDVRLCGSSGEKSSSAAAFNTIEGTPDAENGKASTTVNNSTDDDDLPF